MVQELQQNSVPEELYNLTQLAEVTLIAGKLSTTDVDQIKNYINKSDLPTPPGNEDSSAYYNLQPAHNYHINKLISINYDHTSDNDFDKSNYESTKKKWKNDWENHRKFQEDDSEISTKNYLGQPINFLTTDNTATSTDQKISSVSVVSSPTTSSSLSYLLLSSPSTSDDDSSKSVSSYSHKIFDRKKKRTFPQSSIESDNNSLTGDVDRDPSKNFTNLSNDSTTTCDNSLTEIKHQISDNNFNKFNNQNVSPLTSEYYERGTIWNPPQDSCKNGSDDGMHVCPECGKKYSTSSNLARHRQTHRSLQDKKARRCEICDKVYVSMPAYSMHIRTHNQGCQCPHCGKCFSRPWLLQGHIRTHTGEKPFKCNLCPKAFADKSNLRAHIQTHSTTKNHKCTRCGKSFALKSYLYKHEESSCMKNHLKGETKIKSRKTSLKAKKHDQQSNENRSTEQTLEMTLKNQTSMLVKEKIKEILEDGHKKTYITLKNIQPKENPTPTLFVENRISVIRSLSSANYEHINEYNDPRKLATNPVSNYEIGGGFSIIA